MHFILRVLSKGNRLGHDEEKKKCWISRRNNCRQQRHDDHKYTHLQILFTCPIDRAHTHPRSQSAYYTYINIKCMKSEKKKPFELTERRADDNIQCAQHHTSYSTTASTYFISLSFSLSLSRTRASPDFDVHQAEKFATTVAVAEWNFAAHVYGIVSFLRTCARSTVRWKWSAFLESVVSICSSFYKSNFPYAFMDVLFESLYVHRRPCFALAFSRSRVSAAFSHIWMLKFIWTLILHNVVDTAIGSDRLGRRTNNNNNVRCPMNVTAGCECFRHHFAYDIPYEWL